MAEVIWFFIGCIVGGAIGVISVIVAAENINKKVGAGYQLMPPRED